MTERKRKKFKGTTVATGSYSVAVCPADHIHVRLSDLGSPPGRLVFEPEEAYELAQALLRGYDVATGIAFPGEM